MIRSGKLNINKFGLFLMYIYIFMSYNACDLVFPSILNTISLYFLLAWGVFTTLMSLKNEKFQLTTHTVWYLVFIGFSLLTMLYSKEQRIFSGTFYLMIVALILSYIIQLYINDGKTFKLLGWSYAIASFALIATLFLTGNLTGDVSNRLGGEIMGNANTFASMIMISVMYELWLLIYGDYKKSIRLILTLMILANIYALILSGGRKFFVIPFVFLYFLLYFKSDKKGKRHIVKYTVIVGAIVVGTYILIMNVPVFYNAIGIRMEGFIAGITGEGVQDGSSKIREIMRKLAVERWLESPIWGYGFDSFKYYAITAVGHFFYSHCNYTELLYNGGIVYFISYYWIFWKVFKEAFISKKGEQKYRTFALAVVVSLFIYDYGAVSYSSAMNVVMIAMGLRVLTFDKDKIVKEI